MNQLLRVLTIAVGAIAGLALFAAPGVHADCNAGKNGAEAQAVYDCLKADMVKGYEKSNSRWISKSYVDDYRGWTLASTFPAAPGFHGERYLITYVNSVGAEEYLKSLDEGAKMLAGTLIAKESFSVNAEGKAKAGPSFASRQRGTPIRLPGCTRWRGPMADLILYGMPYSNFVRACAMTAYEKGVEVKHDLTGFRDLRSPQMLAVAQFGKVPAMRHGDVVLFESLAVMRYIDLIFGPVDALQPTDPLERIRMDQWFSAVMSTVDRHLVRDWTLELLFPSGEGGAPDAGRIARARKATARDLAILDRQVGRDDYLVANQLTLADIVMVCTLDVLDRVPDGVELLGQVPNLTRVMGGLRARQSWKKAMEGVTFPEPPSAVAQA